MVMRQAVTGLAGFNLRRWPKVAGMSVAFIGALGLLGWLVGNERLKIVIPGFAAMMVNTALCFILAGVSLWMLHSQDGAMPLGRKRLAAILAGIVALTGLLTLLEYFSGRSFGLDLFLFGRAALETGYAYPGRMAQITACGFFLAGTALLLHTLDSRSSLAQARLLSLALSLAILPALLGFAYDFRQVYALTAYSTIALHTSLAFLLLSSGLLLVRPGDGLMALFVGGGEESAIARRSMAGALVIPPAIGALALYGNRIGWYQQEIRMALVVEANMLVFATLVTYQARRLIQANEKNRHLHRLNTVLSQINQAIVRIRQPLPLFDEVCRIAVIHGGFQAAWVGIVNQEGEFEEFVHSVGMADGGLFSNPDLLLSSPIGEVLRLGKARVCNDLANDPDWAVYGKEMERLGCRALAVFPLRTGEKKVVGILGVNSSETGLFHGENVRQLKEIATDIAYALEQMGLERQREQAEKALSASEERFHLLVDGVKDYDIFLLDKQGRVVSWNTGAERITGFAEDEILGRDFYCFYTQEDRDVLTPQRELDKAASLGYIVAEGWRLRKDGSRFWADTSITALEDKTGQLSGYAKITRDVTERRRAEEEIRSLNVELEKLLAERTARLTESEGFSRAVIETTTDGVVIIDERGIIQRFNPGAEKMFGYPANEVIGQNIKMLMPAPFRDEHDSYLARYRQTGEKHIIGKYREVTGMRKDDRIFPLLLGVAEIWLGDQRLFAGILRDITELKRTEEKLAASNKELESFSYSVSHDLRAPLRAIDGFSQILQEDYAGKLDQEGDRIIGVIRDNTQKMGRLIDDLLAFSRLGRKEMSRDPVDMTQIVQGVCEELRDAHPDRGIEFTVGELSPSEGDAALLRQVWVNLLSNAVKYTRGREPARIEVGSYRNGDETVYFVRDNGAGFDMRYVQKLFGVFQRLHSAEQFDGTGVGLAIVHRVVSRHGGRVWAEGWVEEGASFYFSLPGECNGSE